MDYYKFAAQKRLRFPSSRGELTVEDLFSMGLKNSSGFDLDSVARTIHTELKGMTEESFVEDASANPRKKDLEVALEIVKDVIATKVALKVAAENREKKKELRHKLLVAIEAKENENMTKASVDDLRAQLAALDD